MLEKMVGSEFLFYGVDNNEFKLDDTVYEAIEDENDGYRSYLDSVVVVEGNGLFFTKPLARVRVEELDENNWCLVDVLTGHNWLTVGTDYSMDGYYPSFVFNYQPDRTQTEFVS